MTDEPLWFRVPAWLKGNDDERECFAVQWLLGRWDLGDEPSINDLKKRLGGGWDRAEKLYLRLWHWAGPAGAKRPSALPQGKTGKPRGSTGEYQGSTGEAQTASNLNNDVAPGKHQGTSGNDQGSTGEPHARASSLETDQKDQRSAPPATPPPPPSTNPGAPDAPPATVSPPRAGWLPAGSKAPTTPARPGDRSADPGTAGGPGTRAAPLPLFAPDPVPCPRAGPRGAPCGKLGPHDGRCSWEVPKDLEELLEKDPHRSDMAFRLFRNRVETPEDLVGYTADQLDHMELIGETRRIRLEKALADWGLHLALPVPKAAGRGASLARQSGPGPPARETMAEKAMKRRQR